MQPHSVLTNDLRAHLRAVLSGSPSRTAVSRLITVCHGLAIVALRRKIAAAMLQPRFQYANYADMAYDCIAALFARDDTGGLAVIKTYFDGVGIDGCNDAELLTHLRRLIVSRVNQEIFRIYSDIDPAVGKILRNIKLAIQGNGNLAVVTRFGEWHAQPMLCDPQVHLPAFGPEELEILITDQVDHNDSVPILMSKLCLALRTQTTHARMVPLIVVARVIRSLYGRAGVRDDSVDPEDTFTIPEASNQIRTFCAQFVREIEPKYVRKNRVPRETFDVYCSVIEEAVLEHFLGGDGDDATLFERMKQHHPAMTREEYYKDHRSVVEYLARQAREKVGGKLRAQL
jgi:hypothetical protein